VKLKIAAIASLVVSGPAFSEGVKVDPGKWEVTSTTTMKIYKDGQNQTMPPQSNTGATCITKEDPYFSPKTFSHNQCELSEMINEPRKLYYKMVCQQASLELAGGVSVDVAEDGKTAKGFMSYAAGERGGGSTAATYVTSEMVFKHVGACE